ncbi:MAG: ribonuclease Z [Clostridiales bacterium]|nr:ribonuclease Z [Clostridiales bacterium]
MLDVCLLGTSGMMPLPNRWLTSLMARFNGSSILIDCGEGTQIAIKEKGWSFKPIDVLCITHFHADHISGLPGLLLTMGNAERTELLTIIGPKGIERVVKALLIIAPELPFPIQFVELSEKSHMIEMKGYTLKAFKVNHNIMCYGYSIEIDRTGKFQLEKAIENGIPKNYWGRLQKGQDIEIDGKTFTSDMVLGESRRGIKLTYCTDTRPIKAIAEAALESDLFICEGMYGETGKEDKAREYKHMTFYEAAHLAKEAKVSRLWLTHYSPSLIRPKDFMNAVREIFPNAEAGEDGKSILLKFEED